MKRCPECRRDYYDDSLLYCLDDGSALLNGPAASDPRTVIMPNVPASGSAPTLRYAGELPTEIFHAARATENMPANSVAVLPFVNMSRDEDIEYFSDGLAEELLNVLSKIQGLRVAARTSAFSFKGKSTTIAEIGHALNVGSLVEGSIRLSAGRIRIAVQLVKVADGYQLWSDTYDRQMDDIFAVQDDIARSVVGELRTMLIGEQSSDRIDEEVISEVAEAVKGRAADPEAQRLMLLGRYFLDRTTPEETAKAIAYFRDAVERDPGYALCWAELGRAYSVQAGKAWVPIAEGFELSRDAAKKAISLEPELAEGHAQLGRIHSAYDWDLREAAKCYGTALELAPGSSLVMDGASVLEFKLGRFDTALALSRRVLAQDPLSGSIWHNLGLICHSAGLLAESERAFRRALELGPQRLVTTAMLSLVLIDEGRAEDALTQAQLEPDPFWRLWALTILFYLTGRHEESDAALNELIDVHAAGDAYQIAEAYAMRGGIDEAFEWLDRAIAEHDAGVTHANASPRFRGLHSDPRWPVLLKEIGFGNPV
jgi:TolB-like protein/cytochrome c-type biogenesis protein CcmH/NrfG